MFCIILKDEKDKKVNDFYFAISPNEKKDRKGEQKTGMEKN